LKRRLL